MEGAKDIQINNCKKEYFDQPPAGFLLPRKDNKKKGETNESID